MNTGNRRIQELEGELAELRRRSGEGPEVVEAEQRLAGLPEIAGAEFAAVAAGVRYSGRLDVMLAGLVPGTRFAGVFTQSSTRAAPVLDCERKLRAAARAGETEGLAIIVNSGNANCFTGKDGGDSVRQIAGAVATCLDLPEDRVLTASTGVIGEALSSGRIVNSVAELARCLSGGGLGDAARAIMTTDTFPKSASARFEVGGETVTIAGIAKGSGMIAPNMATMLAFLFTDAKISQPLLQAVTAEANAATFNAMTVDGDTSTNDTVIVAATGKAGHPEFNGQDEAAGFTAALRRVMVSLAEQIARDGEGATKLVYVEVGGAESDDEAMAAAKAVANSPLVKTAVAGEDPNWGRVVMAVGNSGAKLAQERLSIWLGDQLVAENGCVAEAYSEAAAAAHMRESEVRITVDLGIGQGHARVTSCDLTHGYIAINADYRS
ncbi:MAG: bifunctional glutamate N-acetyltransferase/amino-acid acetyltransferase ArgJ [Rhodobacteraceae bacterium]|nr:bifunctional glutamate N-acetyltransferase/amino-acid acetyltransferase ArgJ [Paracoccaceae bacterium]